MNAKDLYNLSSILIYLQLLFYPLLVLGLKSIKVGRYGEY